MSREDPQFKLRLPAELKARIDQAAAENHRSINAELIARLESTFSETQPSRMSFKIDKEKLLSEDSPPYIDDANGRLVMFLTKALALFDEIKDEDPDLASGKAVGPMNVDVRQKKTVKGSSEVEFVDMELKYNHPKGQNITQARKVSPPPAPRLRVKKHEAEK